MKINFKKLNAKMEYNKRFLRICRRYTEEFIVSYLTGKGLITIIEKIVARLGKKGYLIGAAMYVVVFRILLKVVNDAVAEKVAEDIMEMVEIKELVEAEETLERIEKEYDIYIRTNGAA